MSTKRIRKSSVRVRENEEVEAAQQSKRAAAEAQKSDRAVKKAKTQAAIIRSADIRKQVDKLDRRAAAEREAKLADAVEFSEDSEASDMEVRKSSGKKSTKKAAWKATKSASRSHKPKEM